MINTGFIKRALAAAVLFVAIASAAAPSFTADQITDVLKKFRTYDYASDPTLTNTVDDIVRFVADKPELRALTERQMIALLESDATFRAKQFVCHQLWIIGFDASVATLKTMLLDEDTAEIACYALRTNPSDAAAQALRQALDQADDVMKIRIIGILGDRRDIACIDQLIPLLACDNADIAEAAAVSLGAIGTQKSAAAIRNARTSASPPMRAVLTNAWLRCAEYYTRSNRPGDALAIYEKLFDPAELLAVRRSALVSALNTGHDDATALMITAIEQDDPQLRAAAVANSSLLAGPEVTGILLAAMDKADACTQILLIEALGHRDDPAVKDAVTAAASRDHVDVRIAAYEVLARIGDASSAALLCEALGKSPVQPEVETILACLRRMSADGVGRTIVDALDAADPIAKSLLITVIRDRGYRPAVGALYGCARHEIPTVAKAALRAIGSLSSCQALPNIIAVMLERSDAGIRSEAAAAIIAITRRGQCEEYTGQLILRRLKEVDSIPDRCSLMRILPATPSEESLKWLQTTSKDVDAEIRDCAVRMLARYPEPTATETLLDIFETTDTPAHRIVALQGCIRLCRTTDMPAERAVKLYRQAMQRVGTAAEKKLILSGLAEVAHPEALQIALDAMQHQAVKAEASLAVAALAQKVVGIDPHTASAAAQRILKDSSLADFHPQARTIVDTAKGFEDFIVAWQVAGPYLEQDKQYDELLTMSFPPETADHSVSWQLLCAGTNPQKPYIVDLLRLFPGDHHVAYACTWVHAQTAGTYSLNIGSDDGVKAWVNGRLIHTNDTPRAAVTDSDKVPVTLKAGWNTLMLKITQNPPPWEFCARIRNTDDSKADGITNSCIHDQATK